MVILIASSGNRNCEKREREREVTDRLEQHVVVSAVLPDLTSPSEKIPQVLSPTCLLFLLNLTREAIPP